MAVSQEIVTSLVEAVAALNLRVNDAASRPMIQGPTGDAGKQGDRGDDAQPVSDEQIKAAASDWLRANITQPSDGTDGTDGKDGQRGDQGRAPTDDEIQAAVEIWFKANREQLRGAAGKDGTNGNAGSDGRNGSNGSNGTNGTNGENGVGIALIEQRDDKSFWITLTDGQETEIMLPVGKASGFFGGGGSGGGGGGGATLLSELGDVRISAPMDLHVLQYDTASSVWRNGPGILDGGTFN